MATPETLSSVISESLSQAIKRWEFHGWLVPSCPSCADWYAAKTVSEFYGVMGSTHKPLGCKTGRVHCTAECCGWN